MMLIKKTRARKKKTICKGCSYLYSFRCKGTIFIYCLQKAVIIDSPLRKNIDIVNLVEALERNRNFDCDSKRLFSFRAYKLKRILIKILGREGVEILKLKEIGDMYERDKKTNK